MPVGLIGNSKVSAGVSDSADGVQGEHVSISVEWKLELKETTVRRIDQ